MNPGNPIVMHFASGASLFSGGLIILLALFFTQKWRLGWRRTLRDGLAILGMAMMAASATPGPEGLMIVLAATVVCWLVCARIPREWAKKGAKAMRPAIVILVLLALALEARWWRMPALPPGKRTRIVVLGDSISQGIVKDVSWPKSLAERHGVKVLNLAQNGATAESALQQAAGIPADSDLVVIEIGGNDMLGGTQVEQFANDLDLLLTKVCTPGRLVVLMELPLPPGFDDWGRAQRAMAEKHGAVLMPKRLMARALATSGATEDGLHLSKTGADVMADVVWGALQEVLK